MLHISTSELDAVASSGNSVHMGLLGISGGALIGFATTLATVTITDAMTFAAFVALTAVSAMFSLLFGVRAVTDYRATSRRVKELKAAVTHSQALI
jgi:hypothetical protein